MIAVIFEFVPADGRKHDYLDLAAGLNDIVKGFDGFISIERFESITSPGRFVSLSFWRDEEAVRKWRNVQKHREAQAKGRKDVFASYRLRVCSVIRDYEKTKREQAPEDSLSFHNGIHG